MVSACRRGSLRFGLRGPCRAGCGCRRGIAEKRSTASQAAAWPHPRWAPRPTCACAGYPSSLLSRRSRSGSPTHKAGRSRSTACSSPTTQLAGRAARRYAHGSPYTHRRDQLRPRACAAVLCTRPICALARRAHSSAPLGTQTPKRQCHVVSEAVRHDRCQRTSSGRLLACARGQRVQLVPPSFTYERTLH